MLLALAYGSFGDLLETAKLAVKIVTFLRDGRKQSQERRALVEELKTLNGHLITLTFVAAGVHVDPLCTRSLSVVASIRSEVESCRTVLLRFLDNLNTPRGIFGVIALALTEENQLVKFRGELTRPLNTIRMLMLTLNLLIFSATPQNFLAVMLTIFFGVASQRISSQLNGAILQLEQVEPQVRAVGKKVDVYGDRLAAVHEAVLKLPIARGVADNLLFVVDPVGGDIPISLRYCHVYADLDRILKAHLLHRPEAGARYIEQGNYHIVSGEGNTIIPADFARSVRAGMQVEMSIVQRRSRPTTAKSQCPHCFRHDANQLENGWFKCVNINCARKFWNEVLDPQNRKEIEEIASPQIRLERFARQEEPELFRLVHIHEYPISLLLPDPHFSFGVANACMDRESESPIDFTGFSFPMDDSGDTTDNDSASYQMTRFSSIPSESRAASAFPAISEYQPPVISRNFRRRGAFCPIRSPTSASPASLAQAPSVRSSP